MKHNRRVAITGLGALTPVGLTVEESWKNILAGQSGVEKVTHFDTTDYPVKIAAMLKDFDASLYLSNKEARKFDLFVQYGIAAATQALEDSQLNLEQVDLNRFGVAVGSGIGGLPMIENNHLKLLKGGPRKISPFFIPGAIINMVPGYISIRHGLKGPNIAIVTACTTGTHNIGSAMRMIQYGDADLMLAGGAEMASCPLGLGGFSALRALSVRNDDPHHASRPWDKNRDGFVLGDGAGVLVLEEYEHAKARGAKIYAECVGFGMSSDGYHITAPDPDGKGFIAAMENAMNDAGIEKSAIDYINAHGTATPTGDMIEARAVETCFKDSLDSLSVSSTKSMIGHLLGAAGAVEAIFSILSIRDQIAPPTMNLDDPEESPLDFVPNKSKTRKIDYALSNSFGFGGTNGTVIFKKVS